MNFIIVSMSALIKLLSIDYGLVLLPSITISPSSITLNAPKLTASRPHQGKSTSRVVDTLAFLVGRIGCPNPRNPSN